MIDLDHLEQYRENNRIEAKKAMGGLPKSLWETYSAFANTMGGLLLLGVEELPDKSLHALELPAPQRLAEEFWEIVNDPNRVSTNILSRGSLSIEETGGGRILVIRVPRAQRTDRPIYIEGDPMWGTYRRSGEGDYRCTPEEVRAMQRDAAVKTQDMTLLEDVSLDVLDRNSLYRYRARMEACRPGHISQQDSDNEFLRWIGAADRGPDQKLHPTVAGLLMFGREPAIRQVFPNYQLDYREQAVPGGPWTGRLLSSSGTWSGGLYDFYCGVSRRLDRGLSQEPVRNALREALANCLDNADFHSRQGVEITRRPDNITFINPGGFRIGLPEALSGGISDPRNSALTRMLNLIDVGTGTGRGLPNIYNVWNAQGWPPPVIREQFDPERITLTLSMSAGLVVPVSSALQVPAPAQDAVQKAAIVEHLTNYSRASSAELAALLGVSRARACILLNQLAEQQIVVPLEESNQRFYRLKR